MSDMTADPMPAMLSPRAARLQRLLVHLRNPLHRNGYALVAATFSTSVLGFLYWAIAAHRYTADQVGVNASLVTTMMFVTNLASLNFTDVLNRFVPVSGASSRRLVLMSYAIAVALGGISATVFVIGLNFFSPSLSDTLHGSMLAVIYVVATMFWVVFVLQDAVLVGLRKATYVLFENTTFGLVKIALLVVLASAFPASGIFLSWTLPLAAVVIIVNLIVFRRLMPDHAKQVLPTAEKFNRRHVSRFLIADYIASVLWTAAIGLMPLLVLRVQGKKASAFVYLAWTIAYTLYLVSRNMGMALTTEGSRDPVRLAEKLRTTLVSTGRIVIPGALVLAAGAPLFLRFFGPEYSSHASTLLRLLALSTIPGMIPLMFVGAARVQRRLKAMVIVTAATTVPVLVIVPILLPLIGIAAVGVAWLGVETVVAVILLLGELRPLWRPVPPAAVHELVSAAA
jgi:O-antigen/teichoic acid export membrane protein